MKRATMRLGRPTKRCRPIAAPDDSDVSRPAAAAPTEILDELLSEVSVDATDEIGGAAWTELLDDDAPDPLLAELEGESGADDAAEPLVAAPVRQVLVDAVLPDGVFVQGNLEGVRDGRASGWATVSVDGESRPMPRIRVLTAAGVVIAEGAATDFRADVEEAGHGSGWCGFDLDVVGNVVGQDLVLQIRHASLWLDAARHTAPASEEARRVAADGIALSLRRRRGDRGGDSEGGAAVRGRCVAAGGA